MNNNTRRRIPEGSGAASRRGQRSPAWCAQRDQARATAPTPEQGPGPCGSPSKDRRSSDAAVKVHAKPLQKRDAAAGPGAAGRAASTRSQGEQRCTEAERACCGGGQPGRRRGTARGRSDTRRSGTGRFGSRRPWAAGIRSAPASRPSSLVPRLSSLVPSSFVPSAGGGRGALAPKSARACSAARAPRARPPPSRGPGATTGEARRVSIARARVWGRALMARPRPRQPCGPGRPRGKSQGAALGAQRNRARPAGAAEPRRPDRRGRRQRARRGRRGEARPQGLRAAAAARPRGAGPRRRGRGRARRQGSPGRSRGRAQRGGATAQAGRPRRPDSAAARGIPRKAPKPKAQGAATRSDAPQDATRPRVLCGRWRRSGGARKRRLRTSPDRGTQPARRPRIIAGAPGAAGRQPRGGIGDPPRADLWERPKNGTIRDAAPPHSILDIRTLFRHIPGDG